MSAVLDSGKSEGYRLAPTRSAKRAVVTTQSAAIPALKPAAGNPALTAALLVTAIAAATVAGAWFFQLVLKIQPCPLCLEQRYAYYLVIPIGVLTALAARSAAPRPLLLIGLAVLALTTLANAGLAGYHSGVEWGLWKGPTDCSGPIVNLGSATDLMSRLDTVKVVRCDEVQFRFLGLSLAGYNVLISLLMAAIAARGFSATAKR
jgi:disulfide bond formation protein DsbB